MKDQQLLSIVDDFIFHRLYHYALMINGSWGSGKTYFVNNVMIPHLRDAKNLDVNYVSLYGIKDPDEISDKLCERAIRDKITQRTGKNTEGKGAQIATLVIGKLLKYGFRKLDAEEDTFKSIADILPNYDNNVIIFDDLERCQCDVCAVLAYINNFVEHSDASVIVIANEEEIGKLDFDQNQELQMMVVLNQRLRLNIPAQTLTERLMEQQRGVKTNPTDISPEDIHKARRLIFQSGEQYRKTKEKVIGLTVVYSPELKDLFTKLIIHNIHENKLQGPLMGIIDKLVHMAEREKHYNIRSFLFYLEKMQRIFDAMSPETYAAIETVAIYCFRTTISRMKGEQAPEWGDKDYGIQSFAQGIAPEDHPYGFRFVDELVTRGTFDNENVKKVLNDYCKVETARGQLQDDPYQKLKYWYECEDNELETILQGICKNVQNGFYSTSIFPDIVHYLVFLKRYSFCSELCDQIIDSMKKFIEDAPKEKIEPFAREHFILEGEDLDNYNVIIRDISSGMEATATESESQYWNNIATQDNWTQELLTGLSVPERGKRSFIYYVEPNKVYELIRGTSNAQLLVFRNALQDMYYRNYYYEHEVEDLPHLRELYEKLNNTEGMGKIQTIYCGWIRNDLNKIIERLSVREAQGKL